MVFCSVVFSHGEQSQALIHVLTIPSFRISVYLTLSQPVLLGIVGETHLELKLHVFILSCNQFTICVTNWGFQVHWQREIVAVAEPCFGVKASELISIQVDRLTGARTRMELMIGAELGSPH
ncbi:hypothetical protein QL285_009346 [Trifolium repens]|nr:hypothetical protein QL285_009346 [Trifolium repens]